MATLRIRRNSEFNNKMRNFKIFIDGQQVGTIADGETKDFETTMGEHIITAKIDWCSSQDILVNVNHDQIIHLKLTGYKYGQVLAPIGFGLIILHFLLSIFISVDYIIYFVTPIFLLLLFNLTIGRKKYLELTEINSM